jgi:hypothetical protein
MGWLVAKITLILGVAVLAGCSYSVSTGSDTIDPAKIEGTITRNLNGQAPDLRVDSVTCPEGVKPAQGVTFECTVQFEDVQLPIAVTVTHLDLSTGDFEYNTKPAKALLVVEKVEKLIKADLHDQVPNASVDCGTGRHRVVEVGGAMECTISAGGERRVLRVVAKDEKGRVYFEWAD